MEHVVVQTSTARHPSDNGWLYYYCKTCGPTHSVSAAEFSHESWFDHEGYGAALTAFNAAHPHTDVLRSQWAQ